MKATLANIYNNWTAIGKLSAIDLPAKQAYGLARFLKEAGEHYEAVEKQRIKLVEKHGATNDDGQVTVIPEKMGAFVSEFNELLSVEVDVFDPKLTLESLEGAKLSALTFFGLTWLVDRNGDSA